MGNPFVHIDLSCDDRKAAAKFYKSVFDWKLNDMPAMNWTGIDVGKLPPGVQGCGGGMGNKQSPNEPTTWTAYVGVADVKKAIAKAEKAGAKIIVRYMPVGEMGALGIFVDPQGATLGVWESAKKPAAKKPAAKKPAAKKPAAKKKK